MLLLQAKLHLNDEEFGSWRFWFWSPRTNYEPLADDDVDLGAKLPIDDGASFTGVPFLGLEVRCLQRPK
jgi:hypothetical protein